MKCGGGMRNFFAFSGLSFLTLLGVWPVALELGILRSFALNWEFLAKNSVEICVCNKNDKVILIVFLYPGFPSFYFTYIPIDKAFSLALIL